MHPILFEIQSLHLRVHLYGAMYALGFIFGFLWVRYESRRLGLDIEKMGNLFFYILIAGTLGSRILYILVETPELLATPLEIFKIWKGGLVYYGGLIGALLMALFYCHKHKLSFWKVADVYAPGLSLGHALGRLGCFFAGCCYGRQCDSAAWYALHFPDIQYGIAPHGIPLYPTQLIESAGNFILFAILVLARRKKGFDGQIFLLYVFFYALMRAAIEVFRGDVERGYLIDNVVSTSQFISIIAIIGVGILWMLRLRNISQKRS